MSTASWGDDPAAAQPAPAGWQGIMPTQAPSNLRVEELEKITAALPQSWREWGQQTSDLILDFYEKEYATVEEQRAALEAMQRRLSVMESVLSDSSGKYRAHPEIRAQVSALYGRLAPRVALTEAILNTLTVDPQQALEQRMGPAQARLDAALNGLRADLMSSKITGGGVWLPWVRFDDLKSVATGDPTTPEAVDVIAAVKNKLSARETYEPAVKDFVSRPAFLQLEEALDGVLAALNAGSAPMENEALRALLSELVSTTEAYLAEPTSARADAIRGLDQSIRAAAPDGGSLILSALRTHWLNYNLRANVSEGLLRRLIGENRQEASWINECIMEAYISGHQCTNANISVDVQPSSNGARLVLKLDGTIRSNANAYAGPATIQTAGTHQFSASKPVLFDGDRFLTEPTSVWASANNQTLGARTKFSWIPIVGRIAENVAVNEARSRQGQANALTIQKITQEVSTKLNREADDQFSKASMELQNETYSRLREQGLFPQTRLLSSTNSDVTLRARLMETPELGGSQPPVIKAYPADGMVVQIHESLLSNGFERVGLDGMTMTEAEVRAHLEQRLTDALGKEVNIPEAEVEPGDAPPTHKFIFAQEDAVRFTIANGEVRIIIRTGLDREDGEDIPTHIIEVPLKFTVDGNKVTSTRASEVFVRPAPDTPRTTPVESVVRQNVMRQTIQSALKDSTFDGFFDLDLEGKKVRLYVRSIEAESGWLTLSLQ